MDAGKSQTLTDEPSLKAVKLAAHAYHRSLGNRIAQLRKEHQMTQVELARRLGVSQQTVFAYELGDRRIRIDLLPVLTQIFRITSDELLGLKQLPTRLASRTSPRLLRHVENIKQMSGAEQRFILRLAESISASRRNLEF